MLDQKKPVTPISPLWLLWGCLLLTSVFSHASNDAEIATPRMVEFEWMSLASWNEKHKTQVKIAQQGNAEVLFLGDSITEGWTWGDNQSIFDHHFGQYKTANFGIGGDQTQHLLWRLENGATGKLKPKVVVLMIGTNNFGHSNHSADQVTMGVAAIIKTVQSSFRDTKILLMGIFPYDEKATSKNRVRVAETNRQLAEFGQQSNISYYDFGAIFIDDHGNIPKSLMGDFLHPSHEGYQRLATKLAPALQTMMK